MHQEGEKGHGSQAFAGKFRKSYKMEDVMKPAGRPKKEAKHPIESAIKPWPAT